MYVYIYMRVCVHTLRYYRKGYFMYVCMYAYAHTGTIWGMSAELGCPVLGLLRSQSASECPSQMANGSTRHAHLCSSITVNPMFDDSIN